jgi:hypothetical protein
MSQIKTLCLNHYAVSNAGSAPTCLPPQVTITAHAQDHTAIAISGNITLSTSTGSGIWSLLSGRGVLVGGGANTGNATYQFINESQVVLALTHAPNTVTTHATDGTYSDLENSALTITSCGFGKFNACEVSTPRCVPTAASNAYGHLYTKLASTAFQLDLVALSSGLLDATFVKPVTINLLANSTTPVLSATTNCPTSQSATIGLGSVTFAGGRATASVGAGALAAVSPNRAAYRDVRVQLVCSTANCPPSGVTVCAPDAFTVRPTALTVSSTANANALGTNTTASPKVVTGTAFSLTADANTAGYDGTPNFDASKAEWPSAPTGGRVGGVGTVSGYFTGAAAIATGNGATGTNFTYDEVGYFRLKGGGFYDVSFAGYSGDVGNGDCVAGSYSNTPDASGKVGCLIANTAPTDHFGRFIPHHFDEVLTPGCNAGAFTYSGQSFTLNITARNSSSAATQNYSQSFAQAVTLSDANAVAGGSLSPVSVAATAFTGGVANPTPKFTFNVPPLHAPATIKPRAVDADSVSSVSGTEGTSLIRIGRLRMSNVYGSWNAPGTAQLQMPIEAQYWSGYSWVRNSDDTCSTLTATNFSMNPTGWTLAAPLTLAGGGFVKLTPTAPGSTLVCANLGSGATCPATSAALPWLQSKWPGATTYDSDPSAIATFGVFSPEGKRGVYNREMY